MKRFFLVVALFALFVPARGIIEAVGHDYAHDMRGVSSTADAHLRWLRRHLEEPFTGYSHTQVFAQSFSIIALSNFAAGLVNIATMQPERRDELKPLVEELARRALLVSPTGHVILDDHNLYLAHLGIVLGAYRHIARDDRYEPLQARVVHHLVARTTADGDFHTRSYPSIADKWPADQLAALTAISLYDLDHGTALAPPLVDGWRRWNEAHADSTGLYRSAIASGHTAKIPRGCALSWSTIYLAQVAPDVASKQYALYREHMSERVLGIGGFREWPRDRNRGMDLDTGPIVLGVGFAATGFGLGAARVMGDVGTYTTIGRTASLFGAPNGIFARRSLLAPILGEAILFNGETAVRWRGNDAPLQGHAPFALGAWLVFIAWLAMLFAIVRALRREALQRARAARSPRSST